MSIDADGLSPELEGELHACRPLLRHDDAVADHDVAALEKRVEVLLVEERGLLAGLRSLPTPQRTLLVLVLSVSVTAGALLLRPRADLAYYPALRMALTLAVLFALTASASWRLLRPLHMPPPRRAASLVLAIAGVSMPFVLSVIPLGHVGHPAGDGAEFVLGCARCVGFGGLLGLPVLVLALAVRRAHVDGAAVAALAGVAAGLTGNLILQVHCSITDPAHLLGGHALLLIILAGVAWLWRRREGAIR